MKNLPSTNNKVHLKELEDNFNEVIEVEKLRRVEEFREVYQPHTIVFVFSLSREPWMRLSLVRPDDGWFPGIGKIRKENTIN